MRSRLTEFCCWLTSAYMAFVAWSALVLISVLTTLFLLGQIAFFLLDVGARPAWAIGNLLAAVAIATCVIYVIAKARSQVKSN